MAAAIDEAVAEVLPVAEARDVKIKAQVESGTDSLVFDRALIAQVLVSLLDNASRFTPRGGQVTVCGFPVFWDRRAPNLAESAPSVERRVGTSERPNAYQVEVRDTRPAAESAKLEKIFERSISSEAEEFEATEARGLRTCREIIERHQGHIFVQLGEGASFVFVLPNASTEKAVLGGWKRRGEIGASMSASLVK
jgi:signal transduction histidine kinase